MDQLLSSLGYCSRKEAQMLCNEGRVRVDGHEVENSAQKVDPTKVTLDDAPLEFPEGLTVLFHKPVGLVCTHDSREAHRIYDVLPPRWAMRSPQITSVGRLDKETSGLLVITDDGALVQRMTSPRKHVEKVYEATIDGKITPELIAGFAKGVELREFGEMTMTEPAVLRELSDGRAEVTVHEGRYHQVRRMFAAHGIHVSALHRTKFGPWTLGDLKEGEWRAAAQSSSNASATEVPGA
ncbi:MAG: pseudouridine synthase [Archangium sp.]